MYIFNHFVRNIIHHSVWILVCVSLILGFIISIGGCWLDFSMILIAIFGVLGAICSYVVLELLLLILLARLHFSFKDSMYALSDCSLYTFIILYLITIILSVINAILGCWRILDESAQNWMHQVFIW